MKKMYKQKEKGAHETLALGAVRECEYLWFIEMNSMAITKAHLDIMASTSCSAAATSSTTSTTGSVFASPFAVPGALLLPADACDLAAAFCCC